MGKYDPLGRHLVEAARSGEQVVTMTFGEVDRLVDGLPPSSSRRQWWANNSQVQSLAWHEAGWHVDKVDLDARLVLFTRGGIGGSYADRRYTPATKSAEAARADFTPLGEQVDVHVRFEWLDAGQVVLDSSSRPLFCALPGEAGIYRFTFAGRSDESRNTRYFGETDNLKRRAGNYRNPGSSQQTSLRLNARLRDHLGAGGVVSFAVAIAAECAEANGNWAPLDLTRKAARLLAENAAIVSAHQASVYDVENLG